MPFSSFSTQLIYTFTDLSRKQKRVPPLPDTWKWLVRSWHQLLFYCHRSTSSFSMQPYSLKLCLGWMLSKVQFCTFFMDIC